MKLRDRVAVVTGAASGIGRAIALALARRGCHLTLVDIDAGGLGATAREAEAFGVRAVARRMPSPRRTGASLLATWALARAASPACVLSTRTPLVEPASATRQPSFSSQISAWRLLVKVPSTRRSQLSSLPIT